eukprot:353529-Chlamydomonas_euryale.AAC.3
MRHSRKTIWMDGWMDGLTQPGLFCMCATALNQLCSRACALGLSHICCACEVKAPSNGSVLWEDVQKPVKSHIDLTIFWKGEAWTNGCQLGG